MKKAHLGEKEPDNIFPSHPARDTKLVGHRGFVTKVVFHPVYTLIASAGEDAAIKIWDIDTGKLEKTLTGHTSNVNSLDFDDQGQLLASCSTDLSIKIWCMNKYACLKTLQGHEHTVSAI